MTPVEFIFELAKDIMILFIGIFFGYKARVVIHDAEPNEKFGKTIPCSKDISWN